MAHKSSNNLCISNEFPPPLSADGNLSKNWCTWRQYLITFLKAQDPNELCKENWGTLLLSFIGPVGRDVFKKFTFKNAAEKTNFDILLQKLDLHFIYGTRTKRHDENIDKYVADLMHIAVACNYYNTESIVKEKIIQDIMNIQFHNQIKNPILSLQESPEIYLKRLDIHEIILIWKQYENLIKDNNSRNLIITSTSNNEEICIRCGITHTKNKCPAHGKQCANCKRFNHFTQQCKVPYVNDCSKCGTSHVQSQCIAYGKKCIKCGKMNHFSEKCQAPLIENCARCGTDHVVNACLAQGKMCSLCNKPNHLEKQCRSKKDNGTQ